MQIDIGFDSRLGPSIVVRPFFGSMPMRTATLRLLMATPWMIAWLTSPSVSAETIQQRWLISPTQLQDWHADKAAGGPTFSGSPAWHEHMVFIEAGLRERGVIRLERDTFSYQRWYTEDDQDGQAWSLAVDGGPVPVGRQGAAVGRRVRAWTLPTRVLAPS